MENLTKIQVPFALKSGNYLIWARTAKAALGGRGYWSHIEATKEDLKVLEKAKEGVEELSTEEKKWLQDDQLVLAALQSSLELAILEGYSYCETAKELWDTLKQVFGDVTNFTKVFEIKKAINDLHQGDMDFTTHFGKFRSLWAELEMLRPATTDAKILNERREQDKVFGLLLTLSPAYNSLIKHILRDEKLPSLEEICSKIQKEQGSYGLFTKGELPMANKAFKPDEKERGGKFQGNCDHCKKPGHKKNQCWFLHPHLRPANSRGGGSSQSNHNSNQNYPRANFVGESSNNTPKKEETNGGSIVMRKEDLESLIQSLTSKMNAGISLFTKTQNDKHLVVDSGASHHMISNSSLLKNIKPALGKVVIANGDQIPIEGVGCLELFDKKSSAFYMPKFASNLLSVKRATNDLNCLAIFGPNDVHFQDIESGKVLGKGGTKGELYVLKDFSPSSTSLHSAFQVFSNKASAKDGVLWHARLGHPHARALSLMLPSSSFDNSSCEACILGKHCKVVFPHSSTIYENCFDLVHSDVWTSPCVSRDQNKYFVTFIDEKSKYTWITLLPSKDRVFEAFQNFLNYVTNQYNAKIKILRSDNGGEYTSQTFKTYLAKQGIIHQTTCPYTPQQNGVAERKNRHLMEVARSMMFHHNLPKKFWGDAVMTACYLINRTPTKILEDQSPFEVLNKSKPFLEHLRVFGCVCFVLRQGSKDKLDARSIRGVFLGYSPHQKGYKCFDPTTNRTYVSREVKFFEEEGYFTEKNWENLKNISTTTSDQSRSLKIILEHLGNRNPPGEENARDRIEIARRDNEMNRGGTEDNREEDFGQAGQNAARETQNVARVRNDREFLDGNVARETENAARDDHTRDTTRDNLNQNQATSSRDTCETSEDIDLDYTPAGEAEDLGDQSEVIQPQNLRRSTRVKSHPDTWKNKRVYFNAEAVAHPIQAVCSLALLPEDHQAFFGRVDANYVPQNYDEAKDHEVWDNAVKDEVGAMIKNHTWDEEELPKGKKCVSSKWVFTIKYKSNGEIERHKARLVARGFTQTYGEDYTDTFAPVAKQHTVKVVLSVATNLDWSLWQMDVKNAFLQGELEEEVYMTPPPGMEDSVSKGKVLRLRKAIYGLKQSPRAWYHKLSTMLKGHGFKKSEADHTLFTLKSDKGLVVVLVYVDDLIITGDNEEGIQALKEALHTSFDIKDLGPLKYFLGIEVCRSKDGLFLSQRKYTLDLLKLTGKLGCKAAKTPLEPGYKVNRKGEKNDKLYHDANQYRRLVGKLIYLTYTRPDISFAVNQVSQHMQQPTIYHWSIVERILRYLKGNPGQGIWMGRNDNTEIVGYCDADWAGDRVDRRSTTGYCTFIGGNLVTWKTKKQKVVSCSSAEAEYRAMRKLTDELIWLKALITDLGQEQKGPITMHCDNQAAIHIATNSVFHERTKHIEIDCHKVREKIEDGTTLPCYTRSEDQLADIFTKAASPKVCDHIHGKLGLTDLTHP